jgi:hypothetical protein
MIEIIFLAIFISSFLGMVVILFPKIPVLAGLPEDKTPQNSLTLRIKQAVKKLPGSDKFDYEMYLQKLLSKVRVLTMKTENKTGNWLERLRQKAIKKNGSHTDNYWQELKKTKNAK